MRVWSRRRVCGQDSERPQEDSGSSDRNELFSGSRIRRIVYPNRIVNPNHVVAPASLAIFQAAGVGGAVVAPAGVGGAVVAPAVVPKAKAHAKAKGKAKAKAKAVVAPAVRGPLWVGGLLAAILLWVGGFVRWAGSMLLLWGADSMLWV